MWYEVIPCLGIITAALTAPTIINYQLLKWQQYGNKPNYLENGLVFTIQSYHAIIQPFQPYRRELFPKFNQDLYQRDMRLSGNPYVIHGLDNIPDK